MFMCFFVQKYDADISQNAVSKWIRMTKPIPFVLNQESC